MTPERARALNAPLATPRLALEPQTAAHAPLLYDAMQDERIYAWISATPPESVAALAARWARFEGRLSPQGDRAWLNWVVRHAGSGAYVGWVDGEVDGDVATNVGYVLFPPFWGRGYATEAAGAVVAHLAALGVARQRALVTAGNGASARVLEKLGFVRTRVIPENDTIRGVKHDDVEYVLDARGG